MGNIEKIGGIITQVVKEVKEKNKEIKKEQQNYIITKKKETVPIEQNALELMGVLNTTKEEQEKGIAKRNLGNEKYIEIRAAVGKELCKREDIATLLVCFLFLKHHSTVKKRYTFETSYRQFIEMLGLDSGGWQEKEIKKSLDRLVSNFITTNFWWDTIDGERIVKSSFHFLGGIDEGEEKSLRITLAEHIAKSMEAGYLKFLEEHKLKDILKIRSYFAKTLVLLFLKRFWENNTREIFINTILEFLGVKKKYNTLSTKRRNENIKRYIIPAVQEAADFVGFAVTYNDTGTKNEQGEAIRDPKGEEKFRFTKKQTELPKIA